MSLLGRFSPFRIIPIDADTGKPLDPNIGRKTYVTYYDIKKKSGRDGKKSIVAHKALKEVGEGKGGSGKGDVKTEGKGKGSNGKAKEGGSGEQKKESGGGEGFKGADEPWTKEEDAKLRAGKEGNTSWKVLAEEVGRPQGQCKQRWKEIQGQPVGGAAAGGEEAKGAHHKGGEKAKQGKEGGKGKDKSGKDKAAEVKAKAKAHDKHQHQHDKKAEHHATDKKPAHADRHAHKSSHKHKTPSKTPSEARFTLADWQTLQEDDLFSFGELQALSELIAKDDEQSWSRIASKFYDLTGRRVHGEDVRDKFEGMAAL